MSETSGQTVPSSPIAATISQIWMDLFQLPTVRVDDNFFELGGHSVLALKLTAAIRSILDLDISMYLVYMHPKLDEFISAVNDELADSGRRDDGDEAWEAGTL